MTEKIPNIKERVLQLAEIQEDNKQNFFRKVGLKYSNFTGKSKKSSLSSNAVAEILLKYPNTNPDWLLLGKGDVLKKVEKAKKEDKSDHTYLIKIQADLIERQKEDINDLKSSNKELKKELKKAYDSMATDVEQKLKKH